MEFTSDSFLLKEKNMEKELYFIILAKSTKASLKMILKRAKAINIFLMVPTSKATSREESATEEESSNGAMDKYTMVNGTMAGKQEAECGRALMVKVILDSGSRTELKGLEYLS